MKMALNKDEYGTRGPIFHVREVMPETEHRERPQGHYHLCGLCSRISEQTCWCPEGQASAEITVYTPRGKRLLAKQDYSCAQRPPWDRNHRCLTTVREEPITQRMQREYKMVMDKSGKLVEPPTLPKLQHWYDV
jgi:hypothetical protein